MASSKFANDLCLDVHGEIFGFLEPNDQAKLRRTSKYFRTVFNHAFQRGYVAAAIHEGYVEKLDAMHEDGDDGHPLLRVAPVDPKALFWEEVPTKLFPRGEVRKMWRSENDKDATLFVNVRLVLGKHENVLKGDFLRSVTFRAVHVYNCETLWGIKDKFLHEAEYLHTFTIATPCPQLKKVGKHWLSSCARLACVDFSGCTALESVEMSWLCECTSLKVVSFNGCRSLAEVGTRFMMGDLACWMEKCTPLVSVDMRDCVSLRTVLEDYDRDWLRGCPALREILLPENPQFDDETAQSMRALQADIDRNAKR